MNRPSLPTYSDSENDFFHPVFKKASEEALLSKGLNEEIQVKGQFPSPTGPIDFVFYSVKTNKVILPIEIKRTQSSARGPGRRQARDYWSNLGLMCQTKFYCVSNLELTELFRFDKNKPRTLSQKVKLDNSNVGSLIGADESVFYNKLVKCIEEILDIILEIKGYVYYSGLTQFQTLMEASVGDPLKWHKNFIPASFEYIRGASRNSDNLKNYTLRWKDATFYNNNPSRLISLGEKINFSHIFTPPIPDINTDSVAFQQQVLAEVFECGRLYGAGDDIAEIVNNMLAPKGLGIVETDMELAQLVSIFGRIALGRALHSDEIVFDPGSGSGRLLTALPMLSFPSISPSQLWANEIEPQFSESLSLRLGLAFQQVISPTNSAKITISPIEEVSKEDVSNVALVVMNPPFISGVQSSIKKIPFVKRIEQLTEQKSILNHGQVALEILFLELVWALVKQGTSIVSVFPAQHLYRTSIEAQKFREFLVKDFSLSHIVIYPNKGIFESVVKQTVLIVGSKKISSKDIKIVEVQKQLSDIDLSELLSALNGNHYDAISGVNVHDIERHVLAACVESGWRDVIGGKRASTFFCEYYSNFKSIAELPKNYVRRGTIGNGGNTKLTVFNLSKPHFPEIVNLIPIEWLTPVLNTTENMPRILTKKNAPQMSFLPPPEAYIEGSHESSILNNIVSSYIEIPVVNNQKQAKRTQSAEEVRIKLKRDQKEFGDGWVLIQRASRKRGDVSILEEKGVLLSTNVPMVKLSTREERILFASWMLSIFGQLQLEYYSTPQEGMRKLEMSAINKLKYPDLACIEPPLRQRLLALFNNTPAKEFTNIRLTESDYIWSEIIYPADPDTCVEIALDIFSELLDERRGFGDK